ncbi:PREDICTED: uncharacterized protein LOC109224213 [Nicotiana attenuata]|uniref:uncharacterized protein LOC109224213 n=1 Tax=Nicotiana attenuata TaxID=49451 RepID=UPI000904F541|nr:PREDICTED: uncharacterized protein LOC109224213 [Nicotiana attenuata]
MEYKAGERIQLVVDLNSFNLNHPTENRGVAENPTGENLDNTHSTCNKKAEGKDQETAVYAKCTSAERKNLWYSLEKDNLSIDGPWCIGGDFNVIIDPDEKLGGNPHRVHRSLDLSNCMNNYAVTDLGYTGPKFTWCNNWRLSKRVCKRLDRIFVNDSWIQKFQHSTVKHLVRTGSDHRPLFMKCFNTNHTHIIYFRFLDFWVSQKDFMDIVKEVWNVNITGNSMWILQSKLNNLSNMLSKWSRQEIGDINDQESRWEDKIQLLENIDIDINSEDSRADVNKAHAEYIKWLSMQESLLKQKTQTKWFQDGDSNTR